MNARVTGHRLFRGGVVLGGARVHCLPSNEKLGEMARRFDEMIGLVTSSSLVMERFGGTAVLDGEHAGKLGVVGVAGRASGLVFDARQAHPAVTTSRVVLPRRSQSG